jgi:hypothetical protein
MDGCVDALTAATAAAVTAMDEDCDGDCCCYDGDCEDYYGD